MTNRADFTAALLADGGFADTDEHKIALLAWMAGENTTAENNPLATTQPEPGTSDFNYAHVKNYPTFNEGVAATIQTLTNGFYPTVLAYLHDPNSTADQILNAVAASPWGTGRAGLNALAGVRANVLAAAAVEVPGSTAPPAPEPVPVPRPDLPVLREGNTGFPVVVLQRLLNSNGAGLHTDGIFGPLTLAAVRSFQASEGITVDGIVGPITWGQLGGS